MAFVVAVLQQSLSMCKADCCIGWLIVKIFPSVIQDCLELKKPVVVADGLICACFFRVVVETRMSLVC
jgi:hypothetical protein